MHIANQISLAFKGNLREKYRKHNYFTVALLQFHTKSRFQIQLNHCRLLTSALPEVDWKLKHIAYIGRQILSITNLQEEPDFYDRMHINVVLNVSVNVCSSVLTYKPISDLVLIMTTKVFGVPVKRVCWPVRKYKLKSK